MEFSEKLKELRSQKNISQAKLAADIHISRSAVAKWENGLGLPSSESLKLLTAYFGIDQSELLPDQRNAETIVSKNKTIEKQKNIIVGLLIGVGIGLFVISYVFIEPLREGMMQIGLGIILLILGIFNMKGNIASIHWYNRRKVTKENQKSYGLCMGLGTLIIGVTMIAAGTTQAFLTEEISAYILLTGILIGLVLMLYAQIKYNRGIF